MVRCGFGCSCIKARPLYRRPVPQPVPSVLVLFALIRKDKEMDALHGKWKLDKSRNINVEEFLTAQGYPADLVAKVRAADGYFEATPDSGKTRVVISSTGRPSTSHLVAVDEPFQLSTPEGIVLTCKCTVEGEGRFREHYSSPDQGVEFITIREVKGKVMKSETSAKGRSMTQVYNKIN